MADNSNMTNAFVQIKKRAMRLKDAVMMEVNVPSTASVVASSSRSSRSRVANDPTQIVAEAVMRVIEQMDRGELDVEDARRKVIQLEKQAKHLGIHLAANSSTSTVSHAVQQIHGAKATRPAGKHATRKNRRNVKAGSFRPKNSVASTKKNAIHRYLSNLTHRRQRSFHKKRANLKSVRQQQQAAANQLAKELNNFDL